jgi:hypothetical protein
VTWKAPLDAERRNNFRREHADVERTNEWLHLLDAARRKAEIARDALSELKRSYCKGAGHESDLIASRAAQLSHE